MKHLFKVLTLFSVVSVVLMVSSCPHKSDPEPTPAPIPTPTPVTKTYTVTFDSNGGTGTMKAQTFSEGVAQNLTKNTFTRANYTFTGWATSVSGSKVYDDEESITVTSDMTLYAVWEMTTISVTGVKLNYTQIYREQGESFILTATVEPSNASNKTVTWTTSDGSIATVDNGRVTMTGSTVWESTTITATTEDGGKTATCTVTVTQKPTASAPDANGFVTISAGSMPLNSDGSYHVTLTKAYMICDHEVTQKEWQDVMGNNPSYFQGEEAHRKVADGEVQEDRPVEKVSWYEAIAYCNERTKKENLKRGSSSDIDYVYFSDAAFTTSYTILDVSSNKLPYMRVDANGKIDATGYRLPTEAEWEIAARGGLTGDVYAGTDDVNKLGDYAWYSANSDSKTHEVKKKQSNGYGLYDMSGNVLEWCWDWYRSYPASANDPVGASSGSYRAGRGGSCYDSDSFCRASPLPRLPGLPPLQLPSPSYWGSELGFRLVRTTQ